MFFSEINVFFPFIVAFHFSNNLHISPKASNLFTRKLVYLSTPEACLLVNFSLPLHYEVSSYPIRTAPTRSV